MRLLNLIVALRVLISGRFRQNVCIQQNQPYTYIRYVTLGDIRTPTYGDAADAAAAAAAAAAADANPERPKTNTPVCTFGCTIWRPVAPGR